MSTLTMAELLEKQKEDRNNFYAGVQDAWQPVKKNEQTLLKPHNNDYEQAPKEIREQIDAGRKDFYAEWGSDGRLATSLEKNHKRERDMMVTQAKITASLDKKRSKDQDNGR